MMTYRQMFQDMNDEQLDQQITVYVQEVDEYYPAHSEISDETDDRLDANHVYIVVTRESE